MSSKSRRELSAHLAGWLESNRHHLLKAGAGPGSTADRKAALALLTALGHRLGGGERAPGSRTPLKNARRPGGGRPDDPARLARVAGALRDRALARLARSRAAGARELRRFAAETFDHLLAESLPVAAPAAGRRSRGRGRPEPPHPGGPFLQLVFEDSKDAILVLDLDGRILDANRTAAQRYGYAASRLRKMHVRELIAPPFRREFPAHLKKLLKEKHRLLEATHLRRDGRLLRVEVSSWLVDLGDRGGVVMISRDITARKSTEAALVHSEERFRMIFEEGPHGMATVGLDYRFLDVNARFCQMLGYSRKELTALKFPDITHPDDIDKNLKLARRVFAGKIPHYRTEKRYLKKSGEILWVDLAASVIRDRKGRPLHGLAMIEDITNRKRTEEDLKALNEELERRVAARTLALSESLDEMQRTSEALNRSEETFRTIFENAPVMIDSFDERGRCLLWNRECEKTLGWTQAEMFASDDPLSLAYPDKKRRDKVLASIKRADGRFREYKVTAKDGSERTQLWANFRLPDRTLIATGLDITDRKRDEQALREAHDEMEGRVEARTAELARTVAALQEQTQERERTQNELKETERRMRDIMDFSSAVIYLKDTRGRYLFVNKRFEALFKISTKELVGKTDHEFFPKEMADAFLENDQRVLEAGAPLEFEEIAPNPDGPHTYISMKFPLRESAGVPYGVCGISTDITERVRSEMALKGARARLETLLASSPAVIYSSKVEGNWGATFISDNVTAQTGYLPEDFTENPDFWAQHIHPEDAPRILRELPGLLEKGHHRHEYRFLHKDGTYRWMEDEVSLVRDEKGQPFEAVGYWIDLTHRKKAENEAREATERLGLALSASRMGVWNWDALEDRAVWDDRLHEFFGLKPGEFGGTLADFLALIKPEDRERVKGEVERSVRENVPYDSQYGVIWPDGSAHTLASRGEVFHDAKGKPSRMIGVVWDITERERQQEALRRSEAQFARLVESDVIGVITVDIHGNITEANDAFLKMVGYRRDEIPLRWDKMTPPEWRPLDEQAIEKLMKTGRVAPWEKEYLRKDGSRIPILAGVAILDEKKRTCICPVLDLSDLKRTEIELRRSESNLSALFENAQESICSLDKDLRIIAFNSRLKEQFLLAFGRNPVVGENLDEMFPGKDYSKLRRVWKKHFTRILDGESSTIETRYRLLGEQHHYIVSLTPITGDRGVSGVTLYAKDITELKRVEEALERRLNTEKLVADVSRLFINVEPERINDAIAEALSLVGKIQRVDRSRLYLFSAASRRFESAHEWCAEGVEPQIERWRKLPLRDFSWSIQRVLDHQITRIDRVADLPPEAAREKSLLETFGIRSVVAVPFLMRGERVGVLALQVCRSERTWSDESVRGLQIVAEVMANAMERTRAQRDLMELSHKNQAILEAAGEGIYGLDLEGSVTFVNPAAARMIGWEPKDLLGKPMHAVLHHTKPDGSPYPREACPIHTLLTNGAAQQADDEVFWRKDGGCFPVEYIGTPIHEKGQISGAVVTFNDITLRKRAEEIRYLAHLLGELPEAVLVMEGNGKILFWSNGAEKLTGFREVIGDGLGAIIAREDPGGGAQTILSSLASPGTGNEYRGEHLIRRRDGETRLAAMHFSPSEDPSGRRTAWIGVAQEITEARRREREIMHTQRLAEVGTLAAGVAHEINNPLTVLSGNLQTLLARSRHDGPARKRFEQMKRVCDRISTVVNGLLQIAGPTGRQWALSDINEVIEGALALVEGLELKKDIRIVRRYGADLPKLQLLKGGLPTVVLNLLTNALDAIGEGGEITLTTTKLPCPAAGGDGAPSAACAFPGAESSHPRVCLCISDTGIGIPSANLARIFHPSFSTKESGKGTGLGLTLARSIVSIHQGTLDVQSEPGRGTTFRVTLPVS
jgi:PAS domain S-box-containing protein